MKITNEMWEKLDRDELLKINAYLANVNQKSNILILIAANALFSLFILGSIFFTFYSSIGVIAILIMFIFTLIVYLLAVFKGMSIEEKIIKDIENRYFHIQKKVNRK
jgi:predicted aspartyl protease